MQNADFQYIFQTHSEHAREKKLKVDKEKRESEGSEVNKIKI